MLPVTISLGLINFNLLINSLFGSLVSDQAPAAIDKAFRIYQLPQGIFSVAIATVLFPTLARFAARGEIDNLRATMANGMRQILFVLVPAAAAILVLSEPMIRLVYQRGEFTPEQTTLVATALFWFAFSLPTNGLYLLQTRTFFSLQRPWMATGARRPRPGRLGPRRPRPLQALRHRRDRRRHRDRHDRRASSPRRSSCAASSAGSSWAGCSRPAIRITLAAAALAAVSLRRLGPARQRPRARPRSARSSRSASASALGGLVYLGAGEAAAHRRAGADHPPAAPPLDARRWRATCWGSPRSALLAGLRLARAAALRRRLVPELRGRPA